MVGEIEPGSTDWNFLEEMIQRMGAGPIEDAIERIVGDFTVDGVREEEPAGPSHDRHGHVITDNVKKAENLLYCIKEGSTEDALGHAIDLVERLRHQCRRQCKELYGDNRHFDDFTVQAIRKKHHVEECYEDYAAWLKATGQQEIEQK